MLAFRSRRHLTVPLALILRAIACGGSDATGGGGGSSTVVAAVRVTLSDSVVTIGSTIQATAIASNASGATIAGMPVRWGVADTALASVDGAGVVTGKRAGTVAVRAEIVGRTGQVQASGSASARVKRASGTWYQVDSVLVSFTGGIGPFTVVPLSGGRAALVMGGTFVGSQANLPAFSRTCDPVPMSSAIIGPGPSLRDNSGGIVETTRAQVGTYHLLIADFNGDGNVDVHAAGSGCDNPQPIPRSQRDVPKLLLGDGNGTFTETAPLPSPQIQQHAAAIGTTRPGGPVDIFALSGLCYFVQSPADSLPAQYRGANYIPFCGSPGPFMLRNRGDATFTYDNTSFSTEIARAIVGNSAGIVPKIFSAVACDVNGDGWTDLAITQNAGDGRPGRVLLNDKTGRFPGPGIAFPVAPKGGLYTTETYCRDLDGDGKLDLLFSRVDPSNAAPTSNDRTDLEILRGNGDGTFVNVTATALPGQQVGSWIPYVGFADLNGDSRIDLVGVRMKGIASDAVPAWLATSTPGVYRYATLQEIPTEVITQSGSPLVIPLRNTVPVTIGGETMMLGVVTPVDQIVGPALPYIPTGKALVRLFRREP